MKTRLSLLITSFLCVSSLTCYAQNSVTETQLRWNINVPTIDQYRTELTGNHDRVKNLTPTQQFKIAVEFEKLTTRKTHYEEALFWYTASAEAHYVPAQMAVARLYELGLGTEKA